MLVIDAAKASLPPVRRIFRLSAFLGRYAHQSHEVVMRMTFEDSSMYAEEVAAIMKEEAEQVRLATDID